MDAAQEHSPSSLSRSSTPRCDRSADPEDAAAATRRRRHDAYFSVGNPLYLRKPEETAIHELLTIIVVTSAVPSNPCTRMIREVVASASTCDPRVADCDVLVMCDCPKPGNRSRFKSGILSEERIASYKEYVSRLESMAERGVWPFHRAKVLPLPRYRGFAMAVREALDHVRTPFIMVLQHDRFFMKPYDCLSILNTMMIRSSEIKYVGFASVSSGNQAERILHRYFIDIEPRSLEMCGSYEGKKLTPLLFWYDATHIACVEHYRKFVFGWHTIPDTRFSEPFRMTTGDFIEDRLGQAMLADIKAHGLDAHSRYGTYLLDGDVWVQHVHGRLLGTSSARRPEVYMSATVYGAHVNDSSDMRMILDSQVAISAMESQLSDETSEGERNGPHRVQLALLRDMTTWSRDCE